MSRVLNFLCDAVFLLLVSFVEVFFLLFGGFFTLFFKLADCGFKPQDSSIDSFIYK